jgi:hypothetical protein
VNDEHLDLDAIEKRGYIDSLIEVKALVSRIREQADELARVKDIALVANTTLGTWKQRAWDAEGALKTERERGDGWRAKFNADTDEIVALKRERDEAIKARDAAIEQCGIAGYNHLAACEAWEVERDAARERVSTLTGLLDRAVAAVGMDEVADLFVGTEDENAYETFMAEAQRALAVDGTDTPTREEGRGVPEHQPWHVVSFAPNNDDRGWCMDCNRMMRVLSQRTLDVASAGDTSTANPETDE